MAAILVGGGAAIFHLLRKPTIVWTFLLAAAFAAALVVLYGSLRVPYNFIKAFYGLAAAVPLCVLAALGFDLLGTSARWLRGVVFVMLGLWTLNVIATYWIFPTAAETRRYVAQRQLAQGDIAGAIRTLEHSLVEHPDDSLARVRLAKLYLMQKLTAPARQMLKFSAGQGDLCSRHFLLGILLANEGRRNEARDKFRAAMKLAPMILPRHMTTPSSSPWLRTRVRPSTPGGMCCTSARRTTMGTRPSHGFTSRRVIQRQPIVTRIICGCWKNGAGRQTHEDFNARPPEKSPSPFGRGDFCFFLSG